MSDNQNKGADAELARMREEANEELNCEADGIESTKEFIAALRARLSAALEQVAALEKERGRVVEVDGFDADDIYMVNGYGDESYAIFGDKIVDYPLDLTKGPVTLRLKDPAK